MPIETTNVVACEKPLKTLARDRYMFVAMEITTRLFSTVFCRQRRTSRPPLRLPCGPSANYITPQLAKRIIEINAMYPRPKGSR